jgi:hypothetical protein
VKRGRKAVRGAAGDADKQCRGWRREENLCNGDREEEDDVATVLLHTRLGQYVACVVTRGI